MPNLSQSGEADIGNTTLESYLRQHQGIAQDFTLRVLDYGDHL